MSVCTSPSSALSPLERQYIILTQNGLPIKAKPFHWIAEQLNISISEVYQLTNKFLESGVIRRIAAVPNHYKLGYKFNGMTVWDVDDNHAQEFGDAVGKLAFVSHCYLRPRHLNYVPSWNYNLFAMVHGKSAEEIQHYRAQIKALLKEVLVQRQCDDAGQSITMKSNAMLTSTQILKKTGLRLKRNIPSAS